KYTAKNLVVDFIKRRRLLSAAILLSVIVGSVLTVLIPLSIGKFYELALNDRHSVKGLFFDELGLHIDSIQQYFIFFLSLLLLTAVATYVSSFLSGLIAEYFSKELREKLFHQQLSHTIDSFKNKTGGKYLMRYSGDLSSIQKLVSKGIIAFAGDIIFLLIAIIVLFMMNATLATVFIIGIPVAAVIIYLMNRSLRSHSIEKRNAKSSMMSFVHARLNAFLTIKTFNRETPEESQFNKKSEKLHRVTVSYLKHDSLLQSSIPILFYLMLGLVLYLIAIKTPELKSNIDGEQVFIFILLTLYMRAVIKRILKVTTIWQTGKISLTRLVEIINYPAEAKDETELKDIEGNIRFRNVSFAYSEGKPLLKNISFWLEPNTLTLIRGAHGSGKTSVLKLMMKLMQPTGGNIFMDDFNYKDLTPYTIRKQIAFVSDDAPLLGSNIFEAISYSRDAEKRERAIQTLEQLHFTVTGNAEEDLNYKLEEGAKNLSAGQRKMLMIARALNTRKKFLLLDEPLSDLDEVAQKTFVRLLNKLKKKRTIIVVAANSPYELMTDKVIDLEQMQLAFENTGS
ncbi:MAG: ABC transporter ATP-binding protein/permease, partial [Chitinophagales bacterium]|nr:ABC transporter ATP-binding protein/permease [Chitinophagales bacterium]